jgi:hypothetical protein
MKYAVEMSSGIQKLIGGELTDSMVIL